MFKKVVLVSVTAGLLLVGPASDPLSAADYKHSGCSDAAEAQFPYHVPCGRKQSDSRFAGPLLPPRLSEHALRNGHV